MDMLASPVAGAGAEAATVEHCEASKAVQGGEVVARLRVGDQVHAVLADETGLFRPRVAVGMTLAPGESVGFIERPVPAMPSTRPLMSGLLYAVCSLLAIGTLVTRPSLGEAEYYGLAGIVYFGLRALLEGRKYWGEREPSSWRRHRIESARAQLAAEGAATPIAALVAEPQGRLTPPPSDEELMHEATALTPYSAIKLAFMARHPNDYIATLASLQLATTERPDRMAWLWALTKRPNRVTRKRAFRAIGALGDAADLSLLLGAQRGLGRLDPLRRTVTLSYAEIAARHPREATEEERRENRLFGEQITERRRVNASWAHPGARLWWVMAAAVFVLFGGLILVLPVPISTLAWLAVLCLGAAAVPFLLGGPGELATRAFEAWDQRTLRTRMIDRRAGTVSLVDPALAEGTLSVADPPEDPQTHRPQE